MFKLKIFSCTGLFSLALMVPLAAEQKGAKDETLAVVDVGTEIKIVKKSEVEDLQKKADSRYADDLKSFNDAKKQAAKANRSFNKPQPQKVKINVIGTFKTEAEAKAALEKAQEKKNVADPFAVVEAGDELKIMRKSEVSGYEKKLELQYDGDLKSYNEAKKTAEKKGDKFTRNKPIKAKVKVLAATFKTQAEADAYLQKVQSERKPKAK